MISISKSVAEELIRRLSTIQLSISTLETEVTDLKTIYNKQWKPVEVEKKNSSETEVADLKTTYTKAKPFDDLTEIEGGSLNNDGANLITISDDEVENQKECSKTEVVDLTSILDDDDEVEKGVERLESEVEDITILNDVVEVRGKSSKSEVVDLTSISDNAVEKQGESLITEVVDLTATYSYSKPLVPEVKKPSTSISSETESQIQSKFAYSFAENYSISRGHLDYSQQELKRNMEEIDNASFTSNEDGYISIYTDCSYLDKGRAGRNPFKFSVKYSISKNEDDDVVEKQGENLETEVVNLTTIYNPSKSFYPVVKKTGISSQTVSSLQSRFPYSFPENNSASWGHSDYLQQELERNVHTIDESKIEEKDRACISTDEAEYLCVYTDGSYLGGGRLGQNIYKFPLKYSSSNTEVIDLTSISIPVVETPDKSSEIESSPQSNFPISPNKSSRPSKVDIIDKSKIRKIENVNSESFTTDEDGYVSVYTDGSYLEDGRAGIGVWFGPDNPLNLAEPVNRSTKCNSIKTEVLACIQAIKQAHVNNIKKLCINTDCLNIVQIMTQKLDNWKKTFWKTTRSELYSVSNLIENIKWKHVKGHSGIEGNVAADKLARSASRGNIENKAANISAKTVAKGKIGNKAVNKIANTVAQGKIGKKAAKKIAKNAAKRNTGNESATKMAIEATIKDLIQLEQNGAIQYNCVCCEESDKTGSGIEGKEGAVKLAMQGANMSNESFFAVESDGYVQVYIHGVQEKDGQKNFIGIGVWFGHDHPLNIAEPVNKQFSGGLVIKPCAYNGAEVIACIRAIEEAHKSGIKKLSIYSYTNNTINSIKSTLQTATSCTKVKRELTRLNEVMKLLKFLKWTKTTSLIGSEQACILAKKGALMLKEKNPIKEATDNLAKNNNIPSNMPECLYVTKKHKTINNMPEWLYPPKKPKTETPPKIYPNEEVVIKRKIGRSCKMQRGYLNVDPMPPMGYINAFIATSCKNDGVESHLIGIGVWFDHGHPLNLSEPVKRNIKIIPNGYNGAEIVACTRAIEEAHKNGLRRLCISIRNQYTIDYVSIISRAKEVPRFAGKQSELCDLHKALQLLTIKLIYVPDRSGPKLREGFEAADSLARQGASYAEI